MCDQNQHSGRTGIVIKAHQRSYDDPITLVSGERVELGKRELWNDQYLWIWCTNAAGKSGWVPDSYLDIRAENQQATARRDYDAIELTVHEGDRLTLFEATHGWVWVRNAQRAAGWVPVDHIKVEDQ
jgi:hypothetical protein